MKKLLSRSNSESKNAKAVTAPHSQAKPTPRGAKSETKANSNKPVAVLQEKKNYKPSKKEIKQYAEFLGMNLDEDSDFLWMAEEGLTEPLPEGWRACEEGNNLFFYNEITGESTWTSPVDSYYQALFAEEKQKRRVLEEKLSGQLSLSPEKCEQKERPPSKERKKSFFSSKKKRDDEADSSSSDTQDNSKDTQKCGDTEVEEDVMTRAQLQKAQALADSSPTIELSPETKQKAPSLGTWTRVSDKKITSPSSPSTTPYSPEEKTVAVADAMIDALTSDLNRLAKDTHPSLGNFKKDYVY